MHHFLLRFSLLFLLFAPFSFSQDDDVCIPSLFPCGNITLDISYPFHVDNRPPNCSYPGFEITCKNNVPQIVIGSRIYQVKEIDYKNRILTIADKDFIGKTCPLFPENSTLNILLFDFPAGQYQSISFYSNCSTPIQNSAFHEIQCLTKPRNYFYFSLARIDESMGHGDCHVSPLLLSNKVVNRLERGEMSFEDLMKADENVTWRVGFDLCSHCLASGGFCAPKTGGAPAQEPATCFCTDQSHRFFPCTTPRPDRSSGPRKANIKTIIGIATGIGGFLLVCLSFSLILFCKKKTSNTHNVEASNTHNVETYLRDYGLLIPRRYAYSDIKKMTNSFIEKVGQGGYGSVFKGKLHDGRLVAVKVLTESKGNGEEFINEVASIGRTYHINVVSLLGFCSKGLKRALIYEFMPNGSLEKFIYAEKPGKADHLGWEKLYQIAVGIARGLEYLHRGCSTRILHLDIKPHNILLDQDFCPKISDFGLAKLCPTKDSTVSLLGGRGTFGYTAPEIVCRNIGGVSPKSDVYSYGMMVLEMVGGRKNIDAGVENISEIYFPHWIYKRIDLNGDLGLDGVTPEEEKTARKMILVGLWCIQTNPKNRPSMNMVVEMLEGSLENIQMPPNPSLSSPTRSSQETSPMSRVIRDGSSSMSHGRSELGER
ncbi:LEAF RUST 10 DISEASE-RESISTANCE LOCUS RECEPTOR-LIKE PROTEIN KINASE-like 2.4 [Tasmannia lanceolata]|uniref:LEAF RUST 10 DISEASE-RESISTANCE LOCUS RECEPTOR-LIKE PROTEIN KINASE-like 2.4 n=1 Tax=Tasmannia lanceolata TaxID=3420 RepID=UPI0040629C07